MTLHFDEETHTYSAGSERLPSVTQILRPLYDFSAVNPEVLRRAGEFGTCVHRTVELELMGELDESALDENLKPPLFAFRSWQWDFPDLAAQQPLVEVPMYHKRLKYAGTADLRYPADLIDIKSRKCNMITDPLQLVGYDEMDGGNRRHWVLELRQDGTYEFTQVNRTAKARKESWGRFRLLLDHYRNQQVINSWRGK